MTANPISTLKFLLRYIENTIKRAREHPEFREAIYARHHTISREVIEPSRRYGSK